MLLVLAGVFLGTVGLLVGLYLFLNRRALAAAELARQRLLEQQQSVANSGSVRSILRDAAVSELPALDRLLVGREFTAVIAEQMQRAGMKGAPGSFVLQVAVFAAAGLAIGTLWRGVFFGALFCIVGAMLPVMLMRRRQRKRMNLFRDQLPDALDMLVSAMKAGYSFQAAMKFIGEEVPEPLGPEFSRFYEEQRLGMDVRTALLALQARVDSLDLKMFVTAVLIQRETGGNLAEVLGNIGKLMRERAALKGDIETLTAESKLSGRVLALLPVIVGLLIQLINPEFMRPMLESGIGPFVFAGAAVMVFLGYQMMMKIANIDI